MMIFRSLSFFSLVLTAQAALNARCGDCWCAPGTGGTCPTDETGIVDGFDLTVESVLSTFVLTNSPSFLELQAADGSPCYPFINSVGPLDNIPQTQLPACEAPTSTDTSVCAFKYNPDDTTCANREYEVLTYDSEDAAVADGAAVTHTGGCGVCSSAQDWWVRISLLGILETNSILCATTYTLSSASDRFETLVQCYADMGFTTPCATLWAHFGAANTLQCAVTCLPDSTGVTKLNEDDPPVCEYAACLACSQGFQADFDMYAGRTLYNSGVTERIVRPCDVFSRVEHDHCVGTTDVGDVPLPAPTKAPTSATEPDSATLKHSLVAGLVGMLVLSMSSLFIWA